MLGVSPTEALAKPPVQDLARYHALAWEADARTEAVARTMGYWAGPTAATRAHNATSLGAVRTRNLLGEGEVWLLGRQRARRAHVQ